ncbi:MAG TPA: hypothetical protein VKH81_25015 [Candidatus Angelobacter sp.]|nr:hypothetical protein [Candidatus Angelobacter sp.]
MKNANVNAAHDSSPVQRSRAYASSEDFCAIFRDDVDSLYSLALVLTGSEEVANKAFLAALDDCRYGRAVFQEWARSWSRRSVIKTAIRLLDPVRSGANGESNAELETVARQLHPSLRWVVRLARFERFVFVISVLEGHTARECAALLGTGPGAVEEARASAFHQAAGKAQNSLPASYVVNSQGGVETISSLH